MQENAYIYAIKPLQKDFETFNKIAITNKNFTIGRSLGNDVVIPHVPLSRKHCTLRNEDNNWFIQDMSTFGIYVKDKKITKGVWHKLNNEDIIQLDASGDFVYKFIINSNSYGCTPRKRIKLDQTACTDIIDNVKKKFEESQNFEICHLETKIKNAKQMQSNSIILKQQFELEMNRKIQELKNEFAKQIENLNGEKNVVEKQKALLEQVRDSRLIAVKQEMEEKNSELMRQVQKHNETESELLRENTLLKEKLLKEREEFLLELNRESSSKQGMLQQLEARNREQEEARLKERQELERNLKRETELLRSAKEKELKDLERKKLLRESELQLQLTKLKKNLEQQIFETEQKKLKAEEQLQLKMEEMQKLSEADKAKMEELFQKHQLQAQEEAKRKLTEAEDNAKKTVDELKKRVTDRETELAALAAERIHMQAEQSSSVINSLQEQLDKVRSQLLSVETEKNTLLKNMSDNPPPTESTSKEDTLAEVGELMETELQCSICAELFVFATTLNCSHTYCKYCITMWKKKKKECPICRAKITLECRSLVLDSFIEKMVQNLNDEMKMKRDQILKDRKDLEAEVALQSTASSTDRRRSSFDESTNYTNESDTDILEEESEEEYYFRAYGYDSSSGSDDFTDAEFDATANESDSASRSPHPADNVASTDTDTTTSNTNNGSGTSSRTSNSSGRVSRRRPRGVVEGLPGSYYGGYGRCYRCGARGHWAPGCPRARAD